jgi:hypothetical protein
MLPDDLRDKDKDIEFLQKWEQKIPDKITKNAKPWHLKRLRLPRNGKLNLNIDIV